MATQTLSIGRLVRVGVNISPVAAARRGFGALLVMGTATVLDAGERLRAYTSLDAVAADFGTSASEYLAASLYFGQTPRPNLMYVGRWINSAVSGFLKGGILTAADQTLSNFTGVTTGSMVVSVDGAVKTLTALNFSTATNLNNVATIITTALAGSAICTWDGTRFKITSTSTGAASTVSYVTNHTAGVNVGPLIKGLAATANAPVAGQAAETAVAAVAALANLSGAWYGLVSAAVLTEAEVLAVAGLIQGLDLSRIFGVGLTNTNVLDAAVTNDLGSQLKALGYTRTFAFYSPTLQSPAAAMGRAFSVNFSGNRTTITLMYKQMPGIVPEGLTETQAQTLKFKRVNVYAAYNNDTAIYQYGVMSGPAYFDEIHGLDWFKDALQNALYNLLYGSARKVPQTEAGMNQLVTVAGGVCKEAIDNGLVAPGTWNADGFGQITYGDFLKAGYYIYAPPISQQAQAIREQRIAPTMQIALKLAGAIHEVDAVVDVNR
jgi:hypothetical protein